MNQPHPTFSLVLLLLGPCLAAGCAAAPGGGAKDGGASTGLTDRSVVAEVVEQVMVPTYAGLATKVDALRSAVDALATTPDDTHLAAAKDAWAAAHRAWALSEAVGFGPATTKGFAAAIDAWPVDTAGIDQVLAGTDPIDAATVGGLPEDEVGLHAMAYVLCGPDGRSTAADLTTRKLAWLTALAGAVDDEAHRLASAWRATGGYPSELLDAGQPGDTAFPTVAAAAARIVRAMAGECDTLGKLKLAAPEATHDPARVECRFSTTSVAGFVANLDGVADLYLGAVPSAGTAGAGLSKWVAARDPALDARIRSALGNAEDAVGRLPQPFTTAIADPADSAQIEQAAAEVEALGPLFDGDLTTLVTG